MAAQSAPAAAGAPAGKLYDGLMRACGVTAAALFGGMALLVCADVFMRNVGLGTLAWSVEVTEYMLMVATFVAAPWLLYAGDHIRVDLIVRGLPPAARWLCEVVTDLAGLAISVVLGWQCWTITRDAAEQGSVVFKVLVFPEWWLNLPMAFACAMLAVEFARRLRAAFVRGGR
ncbi:putative TRAP-type C4-dicarboxylate transport system small permease [Azoarcus olearius]|uniref:TRAP transporter small permease n=1 Tax=Azoarcus sp. (strain BH72) TaxID=418699 RepID=UPI000806229A|nr:TRAP transporter small permease [Azoarcus olearius]ANQ85449.1 putative TRAP-type C4-dicarboxylate transport system small permease [Azoarcus olearius]